MEKKRNVVRADLSGVTVPDGAKAIPLTKGRYALVDEEDYSKVMEYNWCVTNGYAVSHINGKGISLHRFILDVTDSKIIVDHKFHNRLDNRKSQLRVCNTSQNQINSEPRKGCLSTYKGVSWDKTKKKWTSHLMHKGVHKKLGCFKTEIEAARVYDSKAKELFGEFAYLNFK